LLVLFAYFSDGLKAPLEYAHGKAGEYWDKTFKPSTQVYNCEDPYRRPGYLYIPADINGTDQYKKTRWIPYTDDPSTPRTLIMRCTLPPAKSFSTPPRWNPNTSTYHPHPDNGCPPSLPRASADERLLSI
jgi:hypothetical protein